MAGSGINQSKDSTCGLEQSKKENYLLASKNTFNLTKLLSGAKVRLAS